MKVLKVLFQRGKSKRRERVWTQHEVNLIMAKIDDLMKAITDARSRHDIAVQAAADKAAADAKTIADLQAANSALTLDLASATAAAQAVPVLPPDAANADQVQAAIDAANQIAPVNA